MTIRTVDAWAALQPRGPLAPHQLEFGPLGECEVEVEVTHCGVCHSDVHLVDDDWGHGRYPLVPGHEIVGVVRARGTQVGALGIGDRVGIGWQASACGGCSPCMAGRENLCREQTQTCVGRPGGFAELVRVDAAFAYSLPDSIASEHAAPLLCAGATVFAPLARHHIGPSSHVAVLGMGGLGHLAVQFARVFGAEVSVFSSAADKRELALQLGATRVIDSGDPKALAAERERYNLIVSTVYADLDWPRYIRALQFGGTLCFLGMPKQKLGIPAGLLIDGERSVSGSLVASRSVMSEMLQVAARHRITPMIERMPMHACEQALARVREGQAKFRVVLEA
jgi:uncharacterized zinc-type alcohol dehydrogenase-like protein